MADERVEVIVVEDHLTVRRAVELLLREAGLRVAGVAGTLEEARSVIARRRWHVALMDVHLAHESTLGLVRELLAEDPEAPIVLYTGFVGPGDGLLDAANSGAPGFVLKTSTPATLIDALVTVAHGGTFIDPQLAALVAQDSELARLASLTTREREVLTLLADGHSGRAIADRLYLSPETVRTHVRNATAKLGARTRAHAVALVVRGRAQL